MLKNVFQKSEKYECLSIKLNSQGKIKQDFCLNMTDVSVMVHWTKVYVVQSKNEIMMNVGVSAKD